MWDISCVLYVISVAVLTISFIIYFIQKYQGA